MKRDNIRETFLRIKATSAHAPYETSIRHVVLYAGRLVDVGRFKAESATTPGLPPKMGPYSANYMESDEEGRFTITKDQALILSQKQMEELHDTGKVEVGNVMLMIVRG
jgi:hypothetical protein